MKLNLSAANYNTPKSNGQTSRHEFLLDASEVKARADILRALVEIGTLPGSAEVWTVRCAWLRPAGTRGRYVLAGSIR